MSIFWDKSTHNVTADDIRDLVYNRKLPESRTLDYKQELPSDKDNKKMEFLKDIAALANSSGGVLVYGISEEKDENGQNTGFPDQIIGLIGFQPDQDIRRLDQIIMDGLQPRLKVEFEPIEVDGKWALLLVVPRSLLAPHIIWFNKSGKFYARGNTGNYQMDVHQIRDAFLQADAWEKEADNFRRMRLMDLQTEKVRVPGSLEEGLFIHIVPLGRSSEPRVDYRSYQEALMNIKPLYAGAALNAGFNTHGYIVSYSSRLFYAQYFRNGAVEYFGTEMFESWDSPKVILGDKLERFVVKRLIDYMQLAPNLDVSPPYGIYVSLFGLLGAKLLGTHPQQTNVLSSDIVGDPFQDNELLLPNVIIEEYGEDLVTTVSAALRPVFDVLWQAGGRPESPHYKGDVWNLQLPRH